MATRRALALLTCLAAAGAAAADFTPPATISPEAQAVYAGFAARPGLDTTDPAVVARLRKGLGGLFLGNARRIRSDYTLLPVSANGVPAYWVDVPERPRRGRVLLYIHGGGFLLGAATTDLALPLRIGPAAGARVLSVDYRLAPEHPFPAAVDDVLAAYRWLLAEGYQPRHIGVFGDSAGGALTLSLLMAARDAGLPLPRAAALLSPVADLTGEGDTRDTLARTDPVLGGDASRRWSAYLAGTDPRNPLASPVFGDFRGLPPLLIQVGTREVLLSDAVRVARRARAAGVAVDLDVWEGMWHVWQANPGVPESAAAAGELAAFFRDRVVR